MIDLELNENIRVEDVKVENYEILNSPRIPIASVVLTRQLKQEEAVAAPGAGATAAPAAAASRTSSKGKSEKINIDKCYILTRIRQMRVFY